MTPPTFAGAEQAGVERGQKWCTKGLHIQRKGLPSGKEPACQCRRQKRRGYDPWVRKFPWRRAWLLTTVFLPGESHGQRSLGGYSPKGRKALDTTEQSAQQIYFPYGTVCFQAALSIRPTLSFPDCVHKSVLHVCISIAVLQIGSSVPF